MQYDVETIDRSQLDALPRNIRDEILQEIQRNTRSSSPFISSPSKLWAASTALLGSCTSDSASSAGTDPKITEPKVGDRGRGRLANLLLPCVSITTHYANAVAATTYIHVFSICVWLIRESPA